MTAPQHSKWHFALVLLASVAATLPAAAQQYPSRTIRVIVPFEAGGAPDIVARIVAGALAQPLGQSLIVENRTGANGIVGMQAAATAEPDGYTILNVPPAFVINPSVYKTLPFDIFKDFAPVANIGISDGYLMLVRPGLPVNSVAELIDYAKTHRLLYGSAGVGNTLHLAAALFAAKAGVEMEHVPYRGAAPVMTALMSGTVDLAFASPTASSYVTSGQLRAIGFSGKKPLPRIAERAPGPRDAAELRHRGLVGRLAGAGKNAAGHRCQTQRDDPCGVETPALADAIVKAGYEPTDMSPAEFATFLHAEAARYAEAVKAAKIEPQ